MWQICNSISHPEQPCWSTQSISRRQRSWESETPLNCLLLSRNPPKPQLSFSNSFCFVFIICSAFATDWLISYFTWMGIGNEDEHIPNGEFNRNKDFAIKNLPGDFRSRTNLLLDVEDEIFRDTVFLHLNVLQNASFQLSESLKLSISSNEFRSLPFGFHERLGLR